MATTNSALAPADLHPPGSLNAELRARGLTTRPSIPGRKDILRGGDVVLEAVTADDVWRWLRRQDRRARAAP